MSSKKDSKKLILAKNKLRGLLGVAKRATYDGGKSEVKELLFQGISSLLLEVRESLHEADYKDFLDSFYAQQRKQLFFMTPDVMKFHYFRYIFSYGSKDLYREAIWSITRIFHYEKEINEFLVCKGEIERFIDKGDRSGALSGIDEIENRYGGSLWGVEAKIFLLQYFDGNQARQEYVDGLKLQAGRGFLAYILHYSNVRNEPSISYESFCESMGARLKKAKKIDHHKSYIKYRLKMAGRYSDEEISEILHVEQSHSFIDLFETLMFCLKLMVVEGNLPKTDLFKSAMSRLVGINDAFLSELIEKVKVGAASGDWADTGEKGVGICRHIVPAVGGVTGINIQPGVGFDFGSEKISGILAGVLRRENFLVGYNNAIKLCINGDGFGFLRSISYAIRADGTLKKEDREKLSRIAVLSSLEERTSGCGSGTKVIKEISDGVDAITAVTKVFCEENCVDGEIARYTAIPLDGARISVPGFEDYIALPEYKRYSVICSLMKGRSGNFTDALIRFVAHESVNKTGIIDSGFMRSLFYGIDWEEVKPFASTIEAAIFSDAVFRSTGSDPHASMRRFCYEYFTRNSIGIKELIKREVSGDEYLRKFLRDVCEQSVLDMDDDIDTEGEVESVRVEICNQLLGSASEVDEKIREELREIEYARNMREAAKYVDANRVYVDADSLRVWASKALADQFERYKVLSLERISDGNSIEELILASRTDPSSLVLQRGDEASIALLEMLEMLAEQFLSNSSYGLNSYLSRRIRHNSLHGYLRAKLESFNLITKKDSSGKSYLGNEYWSRKFSDCSASPALPEIQRALAKFSQEFDKLVVDFINVYLHVKSDSNPKGVFSIDITGYQVRSIATILNEEKTLDVFFSSAIAMFWASIEPRLEWVKNQLIDEVSVKINSSFSALESRINRAVKGSKCPGAMEFKELVSAVGAAKEEMEKAIVSVIGWFSQSRANYGGQQFSLDESVRLAIEIATQKKNKAALKISTEVRGDYTIRMLTLIDLVDIFSDCFSNAIKYSGFQAAVPIKVEVSVNDEGGVLGVFVRNSLNEKGKKLYSEGTVEEIRRKIASGEYKRHVSKEGLSGIFKIADISLRAEPGGIDFGMDSAGCFFVDARVPCELRAIGNEKVSCTSC